MTHNYEEMVRKNQEMSFNYQAELARLEAIEGAKNKW